jgi:hypothetical protein
MKKISFSKLPENLKKLFIRRTTTIVFSENIFQICGWGVLL